MIFDKYAIIDHKLHFWCVNGIKSKCSREGVFTNDEKMFFVAARLSPEAQKETKPVKRLKNEIFRQKCIMSKFVVTLFL